MTISGPHGLRSYSCDDSIGIDSIYTTGILVSHSRLNQDNSLLGLPTHELVRCLTRMNYKSHATYHENDEPRTSRVEGWFVTPPTLVEPIGCGCGLQLPRTKLKWMKLGTTLGIHDN
jgi:hypothetical protein